MPDPMERHLREVDAEFASAMNSIEIHEVDDLNLLEKLEAAYIGEIDRVNRECERLERDNKMLRIGRNNLLELLARKESELAVLRNRRWWHWLRG